MHNGPQQTKQVFFNTANQPQTMNEVHALMNLQFLQIGERGQARSSIGPLGEACFKTGRSHLLCLEVGWHIGPERPICSSVDIRWARHPYFIAVPVPPCPWLHASRNITWVFMAKAQQHVLC